MYSFYYCLLGVAYAQTLFTSIENGINIREVPYTTTKVIGQLRHNAPIEVDNAGRFYVNLEITGGINSTGVV